MANILRGKYWAALIPTLLIWTGALVALSLIFQFAPWQLGIFLLMTFWGLPIVTAIALSVGAMNAEFPAQAPEGRLSLRGDVASWLACALFSASQLALILWLIETAYADSPPMLALRTAGITSVFAGNPLVLALAAATQALLVLGVIWAWRRAARTLDERDA